MSSYRLRQVYGIKGVGSALATQGVFEMFNHSYSSTDLATFRSAFKLSKVPLNPTIVGGAKYGKPTHLQYMLLSF